MLLLKIIGCMPFWLGEAIRDPADRHTYAVIDLMLCSGHWSFIQTQIQSNILLFDGFANIQASVAHESNVYIYCL